MKRFVEYFVLSPNLWVAVCSGLILLGATVATAGRMLGQRTLVTTGLSLIYSSMLGAVGIVLVIIYIVSNSDHNNDKRVEDQSCSTKLHRFQLRTLDLFILMGVVSLEVASFAQASIVLFSLFVSVATITVAVVRQRTLLRNLLLLAIVGVWVSAIVGVEVARLTKASSGRVAVGSPRGR